MKISKGYLTKFDRENRVDSILRTLGGSDVTQIFVHSVTSLPNISELAVILPGIERLDERALLLARPNDIVVVQSSVDDHYLKFLSELGVGCRHRNVVVGKQPPEPNSSVSTIDSLMSDHETLVETGKLVHRSDKIILNPYIASSKEFDLAAKLEAAMGKQVCVLGGHQGIVDYANCKHHVKAKALELGVPVPEGETVRIQIGKDGSPADLTPLQIVLKRRIRNAPRAIVKGAHGCSGNSLFMLETNSGSINEVLAKIARRTDNTVYLVETMLDLIVSPNVLMYIEPERGSILCVGVTDQLLTEGLEYLGNIYPSNAKTIQEMLRSARKISRWLQAKGYDGFVGFDFGEYLSPKTGRPDHVFFELNPRVNGSTYPKFLMDHLNASQCKHGGPYIEAFLSAKVKTKISSFTELREVCGHLFFSAETARGVIPYNTGCLEKGRFHVTALGASRDEVLGLFEDFKASIKEKD